MHCWVPTANTDGSESNPFSEPVTTCLLLTRPAGLPPVDPGCGSRDVHIHDVFIENGDDSIVMKQGWPTAEQIPPAGCTRDVLVVGLIHMQIVTLSGSGSLPGVLVAGESDNLSRDGRQYRRNGRRESDRFLDSFAQLSR